MMGQWRVEVSPTEASADDLFLHVIQVGDESLDAMDATELIRDGDGAGVKLTSGEREWTVMFATAGDLSGSVSLTDGGNEVLARDFATDVTPQVGILASAE